MTTCDKRDIEGTESEPSGIISEPKSIDTLLKSTTYQGMTDEEIQRIVDWHIERARKEALNEQILKDLQAQHEERMQVLRDGLDRAEAAFDTAVLSTVRFQTVEGV